MKTIEVSKKDLALVLAVFDCFTEEDHNSCDLCMFCGKSYGNAALMTRRGEKLTHKKDCPVLVAQDMSTGL